jgi:transcriptional regulator with XRE-family HTH domain
MAGPALDLQTILADGMTPAAFAALLTDLDLSQREFASLGGFSIGNVNRWCSDNRKDRVPPPRHAIVMAAMYGMLERDARRALRESIR